MHWLIPRLASFKESYPKAEVRLNVSFGMVDFVKDEIGVAIRVDSIQPPKDVILQPLIREEIGPVCAPSYLHNSDSVSKRSESGAAPGISHAACRLERMVGCNRRSEERPADARKL